MGGVGGPIVTANVLGAKILEVQRQVCTPKIIMYTVEERVMLCSLVMFDKNLVKKANQGDLRDEWAQAS